MATLDSDDVDRVLRRKMEATRLNRSDWYYKIYNDKDIFISSTSISKGSKETLRGNRVKEMARQLGLDTSKQLVELVSCTLSRDDALKIMETNRPPGIPRHRN